jgi:hypothetical protein
MVGLLRDAVRTGRHLSGDTAERVGQKRTKGNVLRTEHTTASCAEAVVSAQSSEARGASLNGQPQNDRGRGITGSRAARVSSLSDAPESAAAHERSPIWSVAVGDARRGRLA